MLAISKSDHVEHEKHSLSFPYKLFLLMEVEENNAVKWSPHGFAFIINNQEKLLTDILPKYFKHTKLTSFQRQLNLYGFRRLTKGEDQGAYFHPKFQRHRKDLLAEIHRLPGKGSLLSLEQVISASRNLPSERYGGVKKVKVIKEEFENPAISKVTSIITSHNQNNHKTLVPAKVSPPRVYASSSVIKNMTNAGLKPMTKSKLTMNIGFFKPQPSTKNNVLSNQTIPINNYTSDNTNIPSQSSYWNRTGSLDDIIEILHPHDISVMKPNTTVTSYNTNTENLSHTDSTSFNSTENVSIGSLSIDNINKEKCDYENEQLMKPFDMDEDQFFF